MKDTQQEKTISIEHFNLFYDCCLDEMTLRLGLPSKTPCTQEFINKHYHGFLEQYKRDTDVNNAVDWYFANIKPLELTDNERKMLTDFINKKND